MKLKVTQIKSTINRKQDQKRIRGMINKVSHLVKVEEISE